MSQRPRLILHVLPLSHPCLTVEAALRIKGLDYECVTLQAGTHAEAIEELYGAGCRTVPGLTIDDEPVHGSVAILERLETLAPEPTLFPGGIDGPVGEAARWAEEPLQNVVRRLSLGAMWFRPEAFGTFGGGPPLDPAGVDAMVERIAAMRAARGLTAVRIAEELAGLPATLARVDELVAAGVLGGDAPNAADLQAGPSLGMLRCIGDLRPLVQGRTAETIATRFFPDYRPFDVPAGAFPAGWAPSA